MKSIANCLISYATNLLGVGLFSYSPSQTTDDLSPLGFFYLRGCCRFLALSCWLTLGLEPVSAALLRQLCMNV